MPTYTRSDLINKSKAELGEIAGFVPVTDSAGSQNLYFYAVNDSLGILGLFSTGGDSDLASVDANTLRILSVGVQYYVMRGVVKMFLSIPRVDQDQVSRDNFARAMKLLDWTKTEFEKAISTGDVPPEINRPSEQVVTWTAGNPDGMDVTGRDNRESSSGWRQGDALIDDLGRDLTDYDDDGL